MLCGISLVGTRVYLHTYLLNSGGNVNWCCVVFEQHKVIIVTSGHRRVSRCWCGVTQQSPVKWTGLVLRLTVTPWMCMSTDSLCTTRTVAILSWNTAWAFTTLRSETPATGTAMTVTWEDLATNSMLLVRNQVFSSFHYNSWPVWTTNAISYPAGKLIVSG